MRQRAKQVNQSFSQHLARNAGDKRRWANLPGLAAGQAIASAVRQFDGLSLLICDDSLAAHNLEVQLRFFFGDQAEGALNNSAEGSLSSPAEGSLNNRAEGSLNSRAEGSPEILHLPDWETLPYDTFSPHQDIVSERLLTLYRLPAIGHAVLIVPVTTLLHRLPPATYIQANSLVLATGQQMNLGDMRRQLEQAGYYCVDTVYEHGEFAIRGSILDLYPMGSHDPYRIELFDDEVASLRSFDTETQRTITKVDSVSLLPGREYPLDRNGIRLFQDRWHESFDVDHRACPLYQDVSQGIASAGLEYYLPLFFDQVSTLFDYIPANSQVITGPGTESAVEHFWKELNHRYEQRCVDNQRPILQPQRVFLPTEQLFAALKGYPRTIVQAEPCAGDKAGQTNFDYLPPPSLAIEAKSTKPYQQLENFILENEHLDLLFCAETTGRREALLDIFAELGLAVTVHQNLRDFERACAQSSEAQLGLTVAALDEGLYAPAQQLSIICEAQLFGERVQQRRRRKQEKDQQEAIFKNLTELRVGAPVVHIDHGVGRYLGLQNMLIDGQDQEFLAMQYADEAKLYVPVSSLHLISRYSGADEEHVPLHRLGSDQWQKAKRKAAEKVRDVAAELLAVYASRAARAGHSFDIPGQAYRQFAADFPFEETPDQEQAIAAVIEDMTAATPMDRLICGDVGFGKTEVAMRAAFVAVQNGRQVAILVPTTLLAQQHYASFRDRFADWPVEIDVSSRFRSTAEQQAIQQRVAAGQIDILIGTHKLLQKGLNFPNLGLVVIDEEHRFGVRQKEILKAMRTEVDILTLTATPIPRTLNMSMSGMRDLSIIATPPARRLSVKTFVRQYDDNLVKEAILREILRGGQVYFLHNDVASIDRQASEIRKLAPEARIGIGHGQLRERELEQVMSDFYHKRFNVLVCSTIIETGIDVPNANTIIINRADKFGLAQLHQLRGRVGRSHHQAYAYLMTPDQRSITADARKRLEAIASAQDLGSGFVLATHDLEIRGAGELLGDEQSGQIQSIGFSLYMEMLEKAVSSLQSGKIIDLEHPADAGSDINLKLPALIPEDYLPDVHSRLILYKRIANARQSEELNELKVEMIDRFGLLTEQIRILFAVTELKLKAQELGIAKIEAGAEAGRIEFNSDTCVDPLKIVQLVQNQPQDFQLSGATVLKFRGDMASASTRIQHVEDILDLLSA